MWVSCSSEKAKLMLTAIHCLLDFTYFKSAYYRSLFYHIISVCIVALASDNGLLLHMEWRGQSVLTICLLVTFVNPAKTAEPIDMPFGAKTWVGPRNHIIEGGWDLPWKRHFWGVPIPYESITTVTCGTTAEHSYVCTIHCLKAHSIGNIHV